MRRISYSQALNEAMVQEMDRDPKVFVYGIGVPDHKRVFGTTSGLVEKFGRERCFDTPLAEDAMTGFGLGAAICGMRPVHIHIRTDFLLLAMNQLVNMVASYTYGTNGRAKVPFVVRAVVGRGWGQGFQHSKSLHSFFAHIPGIKVVLPTTPRDAKGLLTAAIRDDNPVVCIEHRWLYWAEDEVPEKPYVIPIGESQILRSGSDVTIVATSWLNVEAMHAARILARHGVEVEIVDPRTISPFDDSLVIESVKKTGRVIVADNDWLPCGFGAEVVARIAEKAYGALKAPVRRLGFAFTPCPTARILENEFYPGAQKILEAVLELLGRSPINLTGEDFFSHERRFRGPF